MDLRFLRKSKGLSMEQLATIFGVTRQSIYNYECGDREPSIETLKKYSEYFGVPIDSIVNKPNFSLDDLVPLEPVKILKPKDEMEQQLLERFRSLSFDDKLKAINYITNLIK